MKDYEEKFIEIKPYINFMPIGRIPAHKISYLEFGSANKQTIICAHGLTRNAHDFDKLARKLAKDYRVISISYPGRGNSDWFSNKSHYNYAVYVRDSIKILTQLKIKQPYWLGTSMGGLIGMVMAARIKNIFKGLILNDIGPSLPTGTVSKINNYASQIHTFDDLNSAKEYLKYIYSGFGIKNEGDWDYITRHSFCLNEDNKYQMNYDPQIVATAKNNTKNHKASNIDLWSFWYKVQCKILVIHGIKSNILLPETVGQMEQTKSFDLYTINDSGHAPALVDEAQIQFIYDWLRKH